MSVAPPRGVSILCAPVSSNNLLLSLAIIVYIAISIPLLVFWIAPSVDGQSDWHIGADSALYVSYARKLQEGQPDPALIAALTVFPNTIAFPVFTAFILKTPVAMALFNYVLFTTAIVLFKRCYAFSLGTFLALMLLNATSTISLLTVNKEIVDVFAVALFLYGRQKHRRVLVVFALLVSFANRFEVFAVMLLFMGLESRLNPWSRHRLRTSAALLLSISLLLPIAASGSLTHRLEIGSDGILSVWFNNLEMHYMYALAFLPKVMATFFSELINVPNWLTLYGSLDVANSWILLSNNFASLVVFVLLIRRRRLSLRSNVAYFATLGIIIMTISLSKQPRYLYFAYVLFCLRASMETRSSANRSRSIVQAPEIVHEAKS